MKISIGSDHAGFELKKTLAEWLSQQGHEINDRGTFSPDSVDYPDFAVSVAKDVSEGASQRGILVCGSGIGVSIAANKVKGIRAANCYNEEIAALSRAHNDTNILTLGARFLNDDLALKITQVWLETRFEGGRHQIRVEKITRLEKDG